ncbi:hypothetical protein BC829DRAFT_493578 [Chytridium lagenaria]|nr:hypothetical protein BC829DRAFT_493578 [Chytridium lagenaria]
MIQEEPLIPFDDLQSQIHKDHPVSQKHVQGFPPFIPQRRSPSPFLRSLKQRCRSLDVYSKRHSLPRSKRSQSETRFQEPLSFPALSTDATSFGDDEEGEDKTIVEDERRRFGGWMDRMPERPLLPSVLPRACLFLANLSSSKSDEELHESVLQHFEKWGPTLNVKVQRDGKGRPFGFVQFLNISDAKMALKEAPRSIIDGREIRVEPANVNRTLFLSKFGSQIKYKELMERVEQFGPVEELTLLYHAGTRKCRGCAFVKVSVVSIDTSATGRNRSEKSDVALDYSCLFIGKLNPDIITEDLLKERFEKYGDIKSLKLLRGNQIDTEKRDAFAFVRYPNQDCAERAIDEENGVMWLGRVIKVKYREINDRRPSVDFSQGFGGYWEEGSGSEGVSPRSSIASTQYALEIPMHNPVPIRPPPPTLGLQVNVGYGGNMYQQTTEQFSPNSQVQGVPIHPHHPQNAPPFYVVGYPSMTSGPPQQTTYAWHPNPHSALPGSMQPHYIQHHPQMFPQPSSPQGEFPPMMPYGVRPGQWFPHQGGSFQHQNIHAVSIAGMVYYRPPTYGRPA